MGNLLEPWVLLRVAAGLVAFLLFARGAFTAQRVLRRFDVARATEGQLALERQMELASTFVRIGAVVQVLALALSALASDRLSRGVRGAMCAYGVFGANEWGFRSLAMTAGVALVAGILTQLLAFDARVRGFDLVRPIARLTLVMAPLSAFDLALVYEYLSRLDLTVVASCCSVQLDPIAARGSGFAGGPRVIATIVAIAGTVISIAAALFAARSPTRMRVAAAGIVTLVAIPAALAARREIEGQRGLADLGRAARHERIGAGSAAAHRRIDELDVRVLLLEYWAPNGEGVLGFRRVPWQA